MFTGMSIFINLIYGIKFTVTRQLVSTFALSSYVGHNVFTARMQAYVQTHAVINRTPGVGPCGRHLYGDRLGSGRYDPRAGEQCLGCVLEMCRRDVS